MNPGSVRVKAFVKTGNQSGEASVDEVPFVRPGAGEASLRVASCGICGSDVHAFSSDPGFEWVRPPITLGHEFSGTVESVGVGVTRVSPGEPGGRGCGAGLWQL